MIHINVVRVVNVWTCMVHTLAPAPLVIVLSTGVSITSVLVSFNLFHFQGLFSLIWSDKDECSLYKACQYECTNTDGSYHCNCPEGYELQVSGKCRDIDECSLSADCAEGLTCHNTPGGYKCINLTCPDGYKNIAMRTADKWVTFWVENPFWFVILDDATRSPAILCHYPLRHLIKSVITQWITDPLFKKRKSCSS